MLDDARSAAARSPKTRVDPFVYRVGIKDFKSIAVCDIELGPLTLIIGRNGAGKSNFLDALRFVGDALNTTLDHAIRDRGGLAGVRRRSQGHPRNFGVRLDLFVSPHQTAHYAFEIGSRGDGYFVKRELVELRRIGDRAIEAEYHVEDGKIVRQSPSFVLPEPQRDRLLLVAASGLAPFRPLYDGLTSMGFYNLDPDAMRELQSPDAGELLHRHGENLASVIGRVLSESPGVSDRLRDYLRQIVPGIHSFGRVALGPKETLQFKQDVRGSKEPWNFYAASMSDGTLRALGALVAVAQPLREGRRARLVGIEEPETALHPSAAGALMDALVEASSMTQVIVTSHSSDLVERIDEPGGRLLVVVSRDGASSISPIDDASRRAIRDHLYNAGELHRMDQLDVDESDLARQGQLDLFATEPRP